MTVCLYVACVFQLPDVSKVYFTEIPQLLNTENSYHSMYMSQQTQCGRGGA